MSTLLVTRHLPAQQIDIDQAPRGAQQITSARNGGAEPERHEQLTFVPRTNDDTNCPGSGPQLVSPTDGAANAGTTVRFAWKSQKDAKGYTVTYRVGSGSAIVAGTTSGTSLTATVPSGSISWTVRSRFDHCTSGVDSATWHFTTGNVVTCTPPSIASAPADPTINSGSTATLTVSAAGSSPYTYQWYAGRSGDRTKPVGTNSAQFSTPPLTADTSYWVEVTNGCGAASSTTATVHVVVPCTPPTIAAQPADTTISAGTSATFTVTAGGTAPLTYHWYAGNPPDRSTPVGTNANSYSTPRLSADARYWVEVTNGCGAAQSAAAGVTIAHGACPPLAAPSASVVATASSGRPYEVSWPAQTGAAAYDVDEATSLTFDDARTTRVAITAAAFSHVSNGADVYFYRVRSVSACDGNPGPWSAALRVAVLGTAQQRDDDFVAPYGTTDVLSHPITITIPAPAGKTAMAAETYEVTTSRDWLAADPPTGTLQPDGTLTLNVSVAPGALPPGTSTATLSVSTPHGVKATSVSVSLVTPVSPAPRGPALPGTLVIPAVAHTDGSNDSHWISDVRIAHTYATARKYEIAFVGAGTSQTQKTTTVSIDPGQIFAMDDVVSHWFGGGMLGELGTGFLTIRPLDATLAGGTTVATSRLYNAAATGTFGQLVPAVPIEKFLASQSGEMSVTSLAQSARFRSNLGIVEATGHAATVAVTAYDAMGTKLFDSLLDLAPGEQRQLGALLAANNVSSDSARVDVRLTSPAGGVFAYGSVVDNATGDPLFVPGIDVDSLTATKAVLAGVANAESGGGSWRTDIRIFNPNAGAAGATLAFLPTGASEATATQTLSIAPGETASLDDVLPALFGLTGTAGQLVITSTAPLLATARTYNVRASGTFGQFIDGATDADAVGAGEHGLTLLQLEESPRFRSNVGIVETSGHAATVELTATVPGEKVAATATIDLQPNEMRQVNAVLQALGYRDAYNARVTVKVKGGEGRVIGYASVIDNATGDPTYVKAQ